MEPSLTKPVNEQPESNSHKWIIILIAVVFLGFVTLIAVIMFTDVFEEETDGPDADDFYRGVFEPSDFTPKACVMNAPLGCEEIQVTSEGISIIIRNGAGGTVTIQSIEISGCGKSVVNKRIETGQTSGTLNVPCSISEEFRGDLTVIYNKSGTTFSETSTGTVSGSVDS